MTSAVILFAEKTLRANVFQILLPMLIFITCEQCAAKGYFLFYNEEGRGTKQAGKKVNVVKLCVF
jgi:hypothetical protein